MLVRVWDTLALDKEWKDRILSDYADDYINRIKEKKPELVMKDQKMRNPVAHEETGAKEL
jgi:hypothetical protein